MDESFLKLKGKKVIGKNGKYYGRLSDVLVKKGTSEITGIVSASDAIIYRHRFFPKRDIVKTDEVTVFVSGRGERLVKQRPFYEKYSGCGRDMLKRNAVFSDGRRAGVIQNINLDFETGSIIGFEIGSSLAHDLLNGRKISSPQDTIDIENGSIVLEGELRQERRKKMFSQ